MSEGEVLAFTMSAVGGVVVWGVYYVRILLLAHHAKKPCVAPLLAVAPGVAAVALWTALRTWASWDVREDPRYLGMYMALGAAWTGLFVSLLGLLGVSVRDDALDRGNPAAAWAAAGGLLGATLCFAGGNIGDGPSWMVVVFASGLATAALAFFWALFNHHSGAVEKIVVERDESAGIRAAGLFLALGLILGRGVAGDWVSMDATIRDFLFAAWPALPLAAAAVALEGRFKPVYRQTTAQALARASGPVVVYLAVAIMAVALAGPFNDDITPPSGAAPPTGDAAPDSRTGDF